MPWSASALFALAHPDLKQAWREHPALAKGLHHFAQLPHCQMPAVGLLAVAELIAPERCQHDDQIPWDALVPQSPCPATRRKPPPAQLLAALREMSEKSPILFYRGETHGGETIHEESWIFSPREMKRFGKNPLVAGMAAIGVTIPAGGWFEPFTSQFDWKASFIGSPGLRPTPGSLYQACEAGDWDEVERLLKNGSSARGYTSPTPVALALRARRLDMAQRLRRHGHPLNWTDLAECRTAEDVGWMLEQGVQSHPRCAEVMLENGCAEAWRALGQELPPDQVFLAACHGGVVELVGELLQEHPQFVTLLRMGDSPLTLAARRGSANLCDLLLSFGADWDESALYEAAGQGHVELVQRAMESGVSVQGRRWGKAALNHAASNGQLHVLQAMTGADLNAGDQYGDTPLQAAALAGCEQVVEWLLTQGVDLERRDDGGRTALWSAVASGKQSLVDRLLRAGADPEVENAWGQTLEALAEHRQIQLPARQQTTETSPLQSGHQP